MKKPMTVVSEGLGHPEGPYELADGRVVFADSYRSEIGVYDPKSGKTGQYAFVGGAPNACMLGTDGNIYTTNCPNVGAWIAPDKRPPSIMRTSPSGKTEIVATEADGVRFNAPNDLTFGPDGNLYVISSVGSGVLRYNGSTGQFLDVFVSVGGLDSLSGLTFGPDGIFGHPDHIAIGAATDEAFARLRSDGRSGFQRLVHGAVPQSVFERWNRQRAELGLFTFDPTKTYHMRGVPDDQIQITVRHGLKPYRANTSSSQLCNRCKRPDDALRRCRRRRAMAISRASS